MMENLRLPEGFKPLVGTETAIIDDKGRILFSKNKRERLGRDFALVVTQRGCLAAMPLVIWQQKVSEVMQYESLREGRDDYTRLYFGFAEDDMNFDAQGRVVIPKELREVCKLKKDIILIGSADRVEIWAKEEYRAFMEDKVEYGKDRRKELSEAYKEMVGE